MAQPLLGASWTAVLGRGGRKAECWHCLGRFSPSHSGPSVISPSTSISSSLHQQERRHYQTYLRVNTATGSSGRIPLREGKNGVYGVATTRGSRPTQEDTYSVACVHVDPIELRHSLEVSRSRVLQEAAKRWDPFAEGEDDAIAGQVTWFACYDGHGSQSVSGFLKEELHHAFETLEPNMATDTVRYTRSLGGYFRRFTGGLAAKWVRQELLPVVRAARNPAGAHHRPSKAQRQKLQEEEEESAHALSTERLEEARREKEDLEKDAKAATKEPEDLKGKIEVERIDPPEEMAKESMTLSERATLAWLHMDRRIQSSKSLDVGGSTASVALLHSLDLPAQPWYSSQFLSVTSIHIGDTRMLLCPIADGRAIPLTNYHHPDDRAEAERLRKVGAGLITDSFGEARWMGALANTRAFGDSKFKKAGVTSEPEVITQILKGDDFAFIIAFSDGIGGVVNDQEVIDLCRGAAHPHDAAKAVLRYAEALGSDDNATVMCIPLRGWGKMEGEDSTAETRKFKLSKVDLFRDSRQ
ncbi:hypothetical protein CBS101457_000777 [Exobasidium rhododendri]|nr:hypothetical protein CBS101457_000777 [Exobasidium rhododendri]